MIRKLRDTGPIATLFQYQEEDRLKRKRKTKVTLLGLERSSVFVGHVQNSSSNWGRRPPGLWIQKLEAIWPRLSKGKLKGCLGGRRSWEPRPREASGWSGR